MKGAEKKAREVLDNWEQLPTHGNTNIRKELEGLIAAALSAERDRALEDAAKYVEEESFQPISLSEAIRALKGGKL